MNVRNPRKIVIDGVMPALQLDIDGKTATLLVEQKLTILNKYGAVYLGAEFERDCLVRIPADEADGQPAQTLHGFTQDTEVIRQYWAFLANPLPEARA